MNFKANNREYELDGGLRDTLKPDWREIFKPVKDSRLRTNPFIATPFVNKAEIELGKYGISLVGKDILEVGCCYGERSFLMARYEGTKVRGIDVDEYLVNQAPDLNVWNPEDMGFIHSRIDDLRSDTSRHFPMSVCNKVTFQTCGMENYITNTPHEIIISWDVLEHILDLPEAFKRMSDSVNKGGIVYHEYNSFFSITGGHSLCTLDFLYGHCRISPKDFERYIREIRPSEEKTALNFFHKCLNRATKKQILELCKNNGFEVLEYNYENPYATERELANAKRALEKDVLPDVKLHYPDVEIEDLLHASAHIILRKI